jgi:hypothetical protein
MSRARRKEQGAEKLRAGNQWRHSGLVFATEFGTPVERRNILRTIELAAAKAGLEGIVCMSIAVTQRPATDDKGAYW